MAALCKGLGETDTSIRWGQTPEDDYRWADVARKKIGLENINQTHEGKGRR